MGDDLEDLTADEALAAQLRPYFSALEGAYGSLVSDEAIGLLLQEQCFEMTDDFRRFHPLVKHLHGVVLDDPSTSNHHVLICAAPLRGLVLYLSHDDDSRLVFADLDAVLVEAMKAHQRDEYLDERHPAAPLVVEDQVAFRDFLLSLQTAEDREAVIAPLIPSLDLSDGQFLIEITGENQLIGDAVARTIIARPKPDLLHVAAFCREHPHESVRALGKAAYNRILQGCS